MIGRVRTTLASMVERRLNSEGLLCMVSPRCLWPNQGHWRTDWRADVQPWTGQMIRLYDWGWRTVCLESWSTMSDLTRGFDWQEIEFGGVELSAHKDRVHPQNLRSR